MKRFSDLKEGDYIYKLDIYSGNVDYLKISKILGFSPSNFITIGFDKNKSICFHKNASFKDVFGVIYFCNQKECLDRLSKLIKYHELILKTVKKNIQKLKEL